VNEKDHVVGSDGALVTLVEYGDYQCPHCGAAQPMLKQVQVRYGEDLRLVFRHFPLVEIHPLAEPAAEAAEFAGRQGRFWQMHDAIYANQHRLSLPTLIALGTNLGLSSIALRDALASGTHAGKIEADFMSGVRSGVNGTPAFFINGIRHDSPSGAADLPDAIDRAITSSRRGRASAGI
jgi:protein-disulfide isomerase